MELHRAWRSRSSTFSRPQRAVPGDGRPARVSWPGPACWGWARADWLGRYPAGCSPAGGVGLQVCASCVDEASSENAIVVEVSEAQLSPGGHGGGIDHGQGIRRDRRLGDVLVFSSLTPHLTGPNLTGEVRKACILQTPRSAPWCWKGTRVGDRPVARSPAPHPNCTCQLRGMASAVGRCLSKMSAID